jgi:predicted transposase/invertase (TIGR01784 family)
MNTQKHIRFDWAIKKMLRSKANFGILEGFLSELLKEDVKIQEILESEGNRETFDDKYNRVDILVKDSKDQLIIVEIQNTRESDYFYKILYNTAKAITEHIKVGESYKEVKKVITVSVVYFDLGQGKDYVYHGCTNFKGIHNNDTLELSEKQKQLFKRQTVSSIYPDHFIIKVNDFDGIARDNLDQWIYFLKNSEIKDEFNARGLAEAREKLKEINLPEEELSNYRRYLEQLRFEASIAQTIRFDIEYAKKEKAVEMAKKLKEKGIDIAVISETSGLSKEEIEKL